MLNVREIDAFVLFPMLFGAPAVAAKVTLCVSDSKVQVTVPPRAMSTVAGVNDEKVVAVTAAVAGNVLSVTVTTDSANLVASACDVARMLAVPAATPVTLPD